MTFNELDANKYGMTHYEGVFSPKRIGEELLNKAEESDLYFCGLEKGRLPEIVSVYEKMRDCGIKCNFNVIYANTQDRKYPKEIHYYDGLIDNDEMLAGVIKSSCILELMVDKSQPGSSLRMCESIAYGKKLLTNNPFAKDKAFYNEKQMRYFKTAENIDISFITEEVIDSDMSDRSLLSPIHMLEFIESDLMK